MTETTKKTFSLSSIVRFDVFDHLYTEPRTAMLELRERRRNTELKKVAREDLHGAAKPVLEKCTRPRAILFRQLATPTHEILRFLRLAKHFKLEPLILEYLGDKFVSSGNQYKRSLGKLPIYQHTGADGRQMVRFETVCDFNTSTGKPLRDVVCKNGESLVSFHHDLFRSITKLNPKTYCVDATEWFHSAGERAENYYEHFLKLFLRDGILFENFFSTVGEGPFVEKFVAPSFDRINAEYGYKPLIIRLLPEQDEQQLFWDSYPRKVSKLLEKK